MESTDYKSIIAATATVCTLLQFLTGTFVCQKIVQNKSTGDISSFPFVSGCLSTSLWLRYGFLIGDRSIILVNTIGATLFFAYVITFYLYSLKKTVVIRQFLVCFTFLVCTLWFISNSDNDSEAKRRLGIICSMVTILFFAAPLSSLLHVIRVRNSESMPYQLIFATFVVSLQWLLYGLVLNDKFIQVPNFLGCVLSAFQLCVYVKYKNSKEKTLGDFI